MTHFNADTFKKVLNGNKVSIKPRSIKTLQVNITRKCNMACSHCHVDASPARLEEMDQEIMEQCLDILKSHDQIKIVDITGGAPELHPNFKYFVEQARAYQKQVIVRHNLTVSFKKKPGFGNNPLDLVRFFAKNGVEIIASLPGYQQQCVDKQRGQGIFAQSINSLRLLNEQDYGKPGSGLELNLIYNPGGTTIPGSQKDMDLIFKKELWQNHGLTFNQLYILNNFPINRFEKDLKKEGKYQEYMEMLKGYFNPAAAEGVMCQDLVSVAWDGSLYDCDFNQMLNLNLMNNSEHTVFAFDYERFLNREIVFGAHCFACTAGSGSSCTGQTI